MQLTNLVDRKIFADCYLYKHWQKQILLAVFQHLYFDNKSAPKVGLALAILSKRSLMTKQYQHYINGAFCDPVSGLWFDSENPYTGEVWAKIAEGNASDVDTAVKAARAAFDGEWSATGPTARGKLLVKLAEIIEREAVRLGEIEVRDNGKLIAQGNLYI